MLDATGFLKEKGLIKEGFTEFIIHGDFGKVTLNELLDDYHNSRLKKMTVTSFVHKQFLLNL